MKALQKAYTNDVVTLSHRVTYTLPDFSGLPVVIEGGDYHYWEISIPVDRVLINCWLSDLPDDLPFDRLTRWGNVTVGVYLIQTDDGFVTLIHTTGQIERINQDDELHMYVMQQMN